MSLCNNPDSCVFPFLRVRQTLRHHPHRQPEAVPKAPHFAVRASVQDLLHDLIFRFGVNADGFQQLLQLVRFCWAAGPGLFPK